MTKTRLSWATSFLVNQSKSKKKIRLKKRTERKNPKRKRKKKRCAWNGNGSLRCWWIYFKWKNEYNLHMILARLRYNFSLEEHEKKNNEEEEEVVENSQIETHQGQWASENSLHILFGFRYGAAVVVVAVTFLYKKGTAPFQEADFFCFINRCREFKSELRFHGQFSVSKWL